MNMSRKYNFTSENLYIYFFKMMENNLLKSPISVDKKFIFTRSILQDTHPACPNRLRFCVHLIICFGNL